MAISQNFPNSRPSLNLNFARSKTLDPRITFSRTNPTATYVDDNGLIVAAGADEPRFDHDFATGESLGLLVEEQRTNLITYSQDFTQTEWDAPATNKSRATRVTSTGIDDPSGGTTAATFANGGTASDELIWRIASGTANTPYTMSVWIRRRSGTGEINLVVGDNVAVDVTSQVTTEWKRISVTATPSTTTVRAYILILGSNDQIDIWGYQLEEGAFATSYIPTSGSTKTRSPDNVSMTGTNFSDWYNPTEGTIYCSANNDVGLNTSTSTYFYAIEDTSNSSGDFIRQWVWSGNTGLLLHSVYTSNTTGQGSVISAEFSNTLTTDNKKTAVGYAKSDFASYYNGTSLNTDTSGNLPVGIDRLRIGTNLSGHISQLTYYPTRLSNTVLQTLTK